MNVKNMVHTLAYKILNMPIFSSVDKLALEFKPIRIFQLIDKILEKKVSMSLLERIQVIIKPLI